jgi:hypothetical protein
VDDGGRITSGGSGNGIQAAEPIRNSLRRGADHIELVGMGNRDPHRTRAPLAADDNRWCGLLDRTGPEERGRDRVMTPLERPTVGFLPEPSQDRELLLEHLGADLDRRERDPVVGVLALVPAGAKAHLDAATRHLVDGGHDLRQNARMAEGDRGDQHAEADPLGLPGESGYRGPGIAGRPPELARKTVVVVGAEECLEAGRFCPARDGQLVFVRASLLGLDHQGIAHRVLQRDEGGWRVAPLLDIDELLRLATLLG